MAKAPDLKVPKGDYGDYTFSIKDASGVAYDVEAVYDTATFKMWMLGTPGTLLVSRAGTMSTSTVTVTFISGDFDTVGFYKIEIEFYVAGTLRSTYSYILEVTESG